MHGNSSCFSIVNFGANFCLFNLSLTSRKNGWEVFFACTRSRLEYLNVTKKLGRVDVLGFLVCFLF